MERTLETGRYIHRVDILDDSTADGEEVPVYDRLVYERVPARVDDTGGAEAVRGKQQEANTMTDVSFRWLPRIKPTMRIRYRDDGRTRLLNIVSATNPDGRRFEMLCKCKEIHE